MDVLYTGASGGIGRHVGTQLASAGHRAIEIRSRLEDQAGLEAELARLGPAGDAAFIHLAALVSVPDCERDPDLAHRVNVELASATLERVIRWAGRSLTVIYVSTGHVYAISPWGVRIREDAALAPRSVYARTKLEAERAFAEICDRHGVRLSVARVFGLIGPSQPPNYVLPGLISRAREGRLADVPGLDFVRDYLDARDVARSLVDLISIKRRAAARTVNVCSGDPTPIRELLRDVLRAIDPATADARARDASAAPGRPDDVPWLVGDPTAFVELTGVPAARIARAQTVADAVRAQASASSERGTR